MTTDAKRCLLEPSHAVIGEKKQKNVFGEICGENFKYFLVHNETRQA